jgi:homoserine dehydrogenase
VDRRHHQRHHQLHPVRDARQGPGVRRRAEAEAQRLGYAEADPTFDIEGIDAAHKATILSAIAFGVPVRSTRPTSRASPSCRRADIRYAEQLGYRIKLLGITRGA